MEAPQPQLTKSQDSKILGDQGWGHLLAARLDLVGRPKLGKKGPNATGLFHPNFEVKSPPKMPFFKPFFKELSPALPGGPNSILT